MSIVPDPPSCSVPTRTTIQSCNNISKLSAEKPCMQATWCAFSEQLPHHQRQVESAHVNQHPQHLLQVLDELNGTS
jgi:hypothetical protein